MEKFGVKETKESLEFLFDLSDAVLASLESDNKITLRDAPKFLKPIRSASAGVGGINLVPKEIVDMDETEWKELSDYVAQRLEIKNEALEKRIENVIKKSGELVLSIKELYDLKKS